MIERSFVQLLIIALAKRNLQFYQQMNLPTAPAHSIPKQTHNYLHQTISQNAHSPGPIYNTSSLGLKHKTITHSIGKSARSNLNHFSQNTPAPTAYNNESSLQHKLPQYSIPRSTSRAYLDDNPDPAFYNPEHQTTKPKISNFTMGGRYQVNPDNKLPGPGDYQASKDLQLLTKSKNITQDKAFGTATRFSNLSANKAGPGAYEISSNDWLKPHQGTIGNSARTLNLQDDKPGPAEYSKKSCFEEGIERKQGKTISGRIQSKLGHDDTTKDAFNNYFNIKKGEVKPFDSKSQYSIGKAKRKLFEANQNPGPADKLTDTYPFKNSFHAVIPQGKRTNYDDTINNPGPGKYEVVSYKAKTYSIPRSQSTPFMGATPGIGRYQVAESIAQEGKGISIARSKRTSFSSTNMVGVGDYNIHRKSTGNMTISKAERFPRPERMKPGPGDYHIPPTLANLHFYRKKMEEKPSLK